MDQQRLDGTEFPRVLEALRAVPGLTERLARGIYVADVGCGDGDSTLTMATAFPRSRFLAVEPDTASVQRAQRRAAERQLRNVYWLPVAAHQLEPLPTHDLICAFAGIHDLGDPRAALRATHAALADNGVYLWSESRAVDDRGGVHALAEEAGFSRVEPLPLEDPVSRFFVLTK